MPSLSEELKDKLLKIPVRMGKRELGGLLSAQEIDQILALFHQYAVSERQERVKTHKSLCGCPMCLHHSEAYELQNKEVDDE